MSVARELRRVRRDEASTAKGLQVLRTTNYIKVAHFVPLKWVLEQYL